MGIIMYRSPFTAPARAIGSAYLQIGTMWISGHHTGEDWYCDNRTIVSPADGVIQRNRWDKSYGNYVIIQTDDGRVILLAHMAEKALPAEGSRIIAGGRIGVMGETGNTTGVHCHVEVESSSTWAYNSNLLRPSDYIDFNNYGQGGGPASGYKVGDNVVFSTCYRSSDAPIEQAIQAKDMQRNHGVITRVLEGARNPYLLDEDLCWVNDGDIRGFYTGQRSAVVSTREMDLNLRSGASTNAQILASMPKGSRVEIVGESGDWYQVRYGSLTGYASKEYIQK